MFFVQRTFIEVCVFRSKRVDMGIYMSGNSKGYTLTNVK